MKQLKDTRLATSTPGLSSEMLSQYHLMLITMTGFVLVNVRYRMRGLFLLHCTSSVPPPRVQSLPCPTFGRSLCAAIPSSSPFSPNSHCSQQTILDRGLSKGTWECLGWVLLS